MQEINARTAIFSMLEKNIMLVVMKEDAVVDMVDAKENYDVCMELTAGNRYAVLVDGRAYATITSEAREFSSNPENYTRVIAQAIVVTSLASRIIANFLIQFSKQNKTVEMKLFNDYSLALNWLKEKIRMEEQGNHLQETKQVPFISVS
jgi:hypothetical protein